MTRLKCKGVLSISKWLFFHLCRNHCTCVTIFLNMGQSLPLFRLFSSFSHHKSISNWKRVDGVLGIRTCGHRMVGAGETTELWRPPVWPFFIHNLWSTKSARGSNFFCFSHLLRFAKIVTPVKAHTWVQYFTHHQCDQKKLPNVCKSSPKMISLEKW